MIAAATSMMPLLMLGAHMVGDFVTQTTYQATNKFIDWRPRAAHVTVYTVGFAIVLLLANLSWPRYGVMLGLIWVTHFVTDSRRWVDGSGWPPRQILVDQAIHVMSLGVIAVAMGL